jgi:hypothetical protein
MEFLRVNFEGGARVVLVNDNPAGHTNVTINIPLPGTYRIKLEPPNVFSPTVQEIQLVSTSAFCPMEVTFHLLPASVART